jgi:hypothetical protein
MGAYVAGLVRESTRRSVPSALDVAQSTALQLNAKYLRTVVSPLFTGDDLIRAVGRRHENVERRR